MSARRIYLLICGIGPPGGAALYTLFLLYQVEVVPCSVFALMGVVLAGRRRVDVGRPVPLGRLSAGGSLAREGQ